MYIIIGDFKIKSKATREPLQRCARIQARVLGAARGRGRSVADRARWYLSRVKKVAIDLPTANYHNHFKASICVAPGLFPTSVSQWEQLLPEAFCLETPSTCA